MELFINHKRGPLPKKEEDKKMYRVVARVNKETYDAVLSVMKRDNVSMSDFVRTCVENALDIENIHGGYDADEDDYDLY